MSRLYVNVYAVTRYYGGSEEGGWWYDVGEPLASVPVEGKDGEDEVACPNANPGEGDRGCVGGIIITDDGRALCDCGVCQGGERTFYRQVPAMEKHALEVLFEDLRRMFADEQHRSRYSAAGGQDVVISVQDHFAVAYPTERPRYE